MNSTTIINIILYNCILQVFAMNYNQPTESLGLVQIPTLEIIQIPMACVQEDQRQTLNIQYCPSVDDLTLKNTTWTGPGKWKSYQISFITTVDKFLGAQWHGINIGQLVCLYGSDDMNDFPVQLVLPTLAMLPTYPVWTAPDQSNTANCISKNNDTCDCPIQIFYEKIRPSTAQDVVNEMKK